MKSAGPGFLALSLVLIMISSCATVSTNQKEPLGPGELRLVSVEFPDIGRVKQNVRYLLNVKFESDGEIEMRRACVYWDAQGPQCFPVIDVHYGERKIRADISTPHLGYYILKCYVLYVRDGKTIRSNMVESPIEITK
jgi:hypothetical protein